MEKRAKITLGIAGIVLLGFCTYKTLRNEPIFDETEPTSSIEEIFPSYEPIETPTPTPFPKSVKEISKYETDKLLKDYK